MRKPKQRKPNDLSRSLAALDVDHTLIAVVEMSLSGWLVAGIVPGVERQPLKKLKTDAYALLELLRTDLPTSALQRFRLLSEGLAPCRQDHRQAKF